MEEEKRAFGYLVGAITFFGLWLYSIYDLGFLIGIAAGWIPSMVCGAIAYVIAVPLWERWRRFMS
jgi:hypothetical protein